MTDLTIDLDAAARETEHPDGIPVIFKGKTYTLPVELPADVFDPLLDPDRFDIIALIKAVLAGDDDSTVDRLLSVLEQQPHILTNGFAAIKDSFRLLFGDEQYASFVADRPSFQAYGRLTLGLIAKYGVSLGEAFASPTSSEPGGATPSPTSSASTDSTPAPAAADPEPSPAS